MAAVDVSTWDFEAFRSGFKRCFGTALIEGLRTCLGDAIELQPTPLASDVQSIFMSILLDDPWIKVCPAFHGTDTSNFDSICNQGLLVPGEGNNLEVANGATYGKGVYVANANAAWLSSRFCHGAPQIIVCAVLQAEAVKHVKDAQVVPDARFVVPLWIATGQTLLAKGTRLQTVDLPLPVPIHVSAVFEVEDVMMHKQAGATASALLQMGYSATALRIAGFLAEDLYREGSTGLELQNAGYNVGELVQCGMTLTDLGITFADLKAEEQHSYQESKACMNRCPMELPIRFQQDNDPFHMNQASYPCVSSEMRTHPIYGVLTFAELEQLVPPARCQMVWARMDPSAA